MTSTSRVFVRTFPSRDSIRIDTRDKSSNRCCLDTRCADSRDPHSSDVRVNILDDKDEDSIGLPVTADSSVLRKLSQYKRARFQKSRSTFARTSSSPFIGTISRANFANNRAFTKKPSKKSTRESSLGKNVADANDACSVKEDDFATNVDKDETSTVDEVRTPSDSTENFKNSETLTFDSEDTLLHQRLDHLGSFAYVKRDTNGSSSESTSKIIVLPPNEYCSTIMFNQARYGRDVKDSITDKGGTMKNILQSNKSFIHYLTTYPLKNTFRGYIQLGPYLEGRCVALPRHHAFEIFSIDARRDARFLHVRPPRCNACTLDDDDKVEGRCRDCPVWPDERLEFYFDTTINFTLVLKRDPAIHNGSIVYVERIFVFAEFVDFTDSIYVSPFILKNLNGDFDGDAVTVNIIRGLESVLDVQRQMGPLRFFLGVGNKSRLDERSKTLNLTDDSVESLDRKIRYTFSQSLIFRIFTRLTFDRDEDPNDAMEPLIRAMYNNDESYGDDATRTRHGFYAGVKMFLTERLNIRTNKDAVRRALVVFGPFYSSYAKALRSVDLGDSRNDRASPLGERENVDKLKIDEDNKPSFWRSSVWNSGFLDYVWTLAVNSSSDEDASDAFMKRILRVCRSYSSHPHLRQRRVGEREKIFETREVAGDSGNFSKIFSSDYPLMTDKILCAYNWLVVYSGAKASPVELVALYERCRDYRVSHETAVEIDRPSTTNSTATTRPTTPNNIGISGNSNIAEYEDLYRRCDYSKIQEYKNYMDNFVLVSKNVPRSSYFATGLKWIAQICSVNNGDFYMNKRRILSDVNRYLRDINER